jgi:hypothetical protein
MRPDVRLLPAVLAILIGAGCAVKEPVTGGATDIAAEARTFMNEYLQDLDGRNPTVIAARYHPDGVWLLGNGRKEFLSRDSLTALYAAGIPAAPPMEAEWKDLSFEPVGPDAVLVTGFFLWRTKDGKAGDTLSYATLLLRVGGSLKIRMEDESSSRPVPRP